MKKLLMMTAACGLVMAAAPAHAEVELNLGGYFKGYGAFVDQDEATGFQTNDVDFIRDTEIHLGGETTLDNGLVVGAHFEFEVDGGDGTAVNESYVYFAGQWGRVNFGSEDGAGYLLQVAAPSADSNIDGIRQYVQPVNYGAMFGAGVTLPVPLDYDMNTAAKSDKITYLTPIMNGFQAGVSYTPDTETSVTGVGIVAGAPAVVTVPTTGFASDLAGIGYDDVDDVFGETYEGAVRYEGQFDAVGVILGAGYAHSELESETPGLPVGDRTDDRKAWNVGADFDIGAFGFGAAYKEDNYGEVSTTAGGATTADDEELWVVGADYTTGAFKFGVSYYDAENTLGVAGLDTQRYSGGVTYTYGPGMTFRGSVGYVEHDTAAAATADPDATYVTLGTQINF